MAAPQNHWKLGLFMVAGLALALATVAILGARSMRREVGQYVSFFDESVQGLEVGAPIKFRGVTIGAVARIQVAPDRRHVEVGSELGVAELSRLGLDIAKGPIILGVPLKLEMTADLRLQLASAGLTGVKFLQLDFFDVEVYPKPELPFPVPDNMIPTAPSMMKSIEDSLTHIMDSLPGVSDQIVVILGEIDALIREVRDQEYPRRVTTVIDTVDELLVTLDSLLVAVERKLEAVDTDGISRGTKRLLADVRAAVRRMDALLARVGEDEGLLTSVVRASRAVGDTLRGADGLGGEVADTLVTLQAAARALRMFFAALELDPDMLLKGRSTEHKP